MLYKRAILTLVKFLTLFLMDKQPGSITGDLRDNDSTKELQQEGEELFSKTRCSIVANIQFAEERQKITCQLLKSSQKVRKFSDIICKIYLYRNM